MELLERVPVAVRTKASGLRLLRINSRSVVPLIVAIHKVTLTLMWVANNDNGGVTDGAPCHPGVIT
jgi:hypothetical protein